MTMPSDIERIAEGLSAAQRETLLNGSCGVPRSNCEWSSDCICADHLVAIELIGLGLACRRERYPNGIVVSPTGLAVREYLGRGRVG